MKTKVENIPEDLKSVSQWVCVSGADKIPKNPYNGKNAKANDPSTWGTFEQAVKACETFGFEYIGFEFTPPYFGVDLDHCIDNVDFCDEFIETLQSYNEISKSGDGLHIICKGSLPEGAKRKGGVEMYSSGRYFIFTGNVLCDKYKTIEDCTERVKMLHHKFLTTPNIKMRREPTVELDDIEVVEKARNCKSGAAFSMLYSGDWCMFPSQSEADLALCSYLAFWTGRNATQIDRIFRNSGLMRDKWDKKRGQDTYGSITISKACASCDEVYNPKEHGSGTELALAFFGKSKPKAKRKSYDMTDTGNAKRFFDYCDGNIRYSYVRKKWYFWDGEKWVVDMEGKIKREADEVCEQIKQDAFLVDDDDLQKEILKWARKTANSNGKESMVKECQHLEGVPVMPEDFDGHEIYINCKNGIVNLKTGDLLPHVRELMMSKITMCEYDAQHRQPKKWLQFLNDVTNNNQGMIEYIQRSLGYSVTGSEVEQCMWFLYGMGRNGKSTFLDTIADILGDYATSTQAEVFTVQGRGGNSGSANSSLARLLQSRFCVCEEPEEGKRLNESLVKQVTGGSKIAVRRLYEEEYEYQPEFKIWMATNHKPNIRGTDFGIWRRIKLLPFETIIPDEKIDKNMKFWLREEAPQILAWIVEGAVKWYHDNDLKEPGEVKTAVKEYRKEMDIIALFIEQCVIIDYDETVGISASELFEVYHAWAKKNNEFDMSSQRFGREMTKKTPEKVKTNKGVFYRKIKLTEYALSLLPKKYSAEDFE